MFSLFPSIPYSWEQTMKINPYLGFEGNCGDAFRFYQGILSGELNMMTFGESPACDTVGPEWQNAVMHAHLAFDGGELMGSDMPGPHFQKPQGISIALHLDSPDETERVFNALSDGATVTMPLAETFWSPSFGMLTDRFGISWMVNYTPAAVPA